MGRCVMVRCGVRRCGVVKPPTECTICVDQWGVISTIGAFWVIGFLGLVVVGDHEPFVIEELHSIFLGATFRFVGVLGFDVGGLFRLFVSACQRVVWVGVGCGGGGGCGEGAVGRKKGVWRGKCVCVCVCVVVVVGGSCG